MTATYLFLHKCVQCHQCQISKVDGLVRVLSGVSQHFLGVLLGQVHGLDCFFLGGLQSLPYFLRVLCKQLFTDRRAVDADALAHSDQVGRGEQAGFDAGVVVVEDRLSQGACRALSLCASDMDQVELIKVLGLVSDALEVVSHLWQTLFVHSGACLA